MNDPASGTGRIRLLLADDHTLFRHGIRALLVSVPDIELVGEAAGGEEAVVLAAQLEPDVVLMDIKMPGMDGITATGHIRALPGPERTIPIIAMTANVLPEQVRAFRAAGMTGYIGKPFNRADLYAAIAQAKEGGTDASSP